MSYCQLNDVAYHFRFYYSIAESIKDSRDVVFIILAGQHKVMGSWSKAGMHNPWPGSGPRACLIQPPEQVKKYKKLLVNEFYE